MDECPQPAVRSFDCPGRGRKSRLEKVTGAKASPKKQNNELLQRESTRERTEKPGELAWLFRAGEL